MSKTPNYDVKVKAILDATKPGERVCELTGEKWNMTEEEIGWYRKFNVPPSKYSPNTRWKILAYFSTGFQFWWNKHFETGESVLSFHHPATGIRVLPDQEWLERDFSNVSLLLSTDQSFFDQLYILTRKVPYRATYDLVPPEQSISLVSLGEQDCYFTLGSRGKRNFFSWVCMDGENSSLVFLSNNVVDSHQILHCNRIFQCKYLRECFDCMDSCFLFDCRSCQYCFGASNKRNRKYLWWNEQLSKEEWEKRRAEVNLGKRSVVEECEQSFEKLLLEDTIWPENFNEKTTDSTGEYLNGSVNCSQCYSAVSGSLYNFRCTYSIGSCSHCAFCWGSKDTSESYFSVTIAGSNKCQFCFRCPQNDTCYYCLMCDNCQYCFGCVGLRRKKYYILNQPYTEENYWKEVDKIMCKMLEDNEHGDFFPTKFSSTYGPESGAAVYCGSSVEEIRQLGPNNFDPNEQGATQRKEIDPKLIRLRTDIPDSIDELTDDWIGVPIYDEEAKRTFAFLKPEIEHYRSVHVAPPNTHFIRRTNKASVLGQLCSLEKRLCSNCAKESLVAKCENYPDRKIYCKSCYLNYLEEHG
ncbi:hypothetical protein CO172_01905 [Candidatus Uhrbacteria bacterium CG_4_9_14_3_um_filter_36_7]|uniref:Caib/baif family protein n=1 Tax=Candidatus Uhrbacteria bacterium CG_4_9_14_3_um_filter_36_7 TaxID=1975033 RepID=A0A2M7XHP5_9BACT|nr:MAG: hypothetical protein CO172_01905 [Candidatus Uhrbacteria bacterium CG_4_9_14_3_um_filter_36_7]